MAITLNALTTGVGGLQTTADTSGQISLQSNGSTVLAMTGSGVAVTGTMTVGGNSVLNAGTTVTSSQGGTGLTSFTSGGAMYATSTSALTTGTLPIASGGTGTTSTTFVNAATNVTGTLPVANGGTGRTTNTAYAVICGGTTTGGAEQSIASVGTSGQVLTSNGAGALPTFQSLPAGGVTSLNGQTGAITNTTLYAIGSYVSGRPQDRTNYGPDATVAGSSLYATGTAVQRGASQWNIPGAGTIAVVLVNTGTWRCMSNAVIDSTNSVASAGIWVRIS